ncbi:unnamed protein product [Symbiodinium microadriaticum]|nr:unnamed protein product [Symbiodinium microadriaticum]
MHFETHRSKQCQSMSADLMDGQKIVKFMLSFSNAGEAWSQWTKLSVYTGTGDIDEHVSELVQTMKEKLDVRNNTLISSTQTSNMPNNPVRGTYIEQLMVAMLLSSTPGISADYAEPGTGKTVAATLAITAVANERRDEACVLLQGNLNQRLRAFFSHN